MHISSLPAQTEISLKARNYYYILISKIRNRSQNERYWDNMFPDRPIWSQMYKSRIKTQVVNKIADFQFKHLQSAIMSGKSLWKISNSNKCRSCCDVTENSNHLFVACPKLTDIRLMIELIMKHQGSNFHTEICYLGIK